MPDSPLHTPVLTWYAAHRRDLPWRRPGASAWSVLVSEFMLQQTPVARVVPVHEAWLRTWPEPSALAADSPGAAVRSWGRLGYPRRALRLHAAATAIRDRHGGDVPANYAALRGLPGVGDYTAAAVASFAFGRRHVVLDTNVRRVLARCLSGAEQPPPTVTAAERRLAESVLPDEDRQAATWAVAPMELGALTCTARSPACHACPVIDRCAWRQAGTPQHQGARRKAQAYAGTDRQCRGNLLAVLREAPGPVRGSRLEQAWEDQAQRARALDALIADGLVEAVGDQLFSLPG